uniref:Transglutaminase elicitor n=1 Tax=Phytophthora ramorum TaxID=164328 RepID=H3GZC8_PHYRM
MVFLPSTYLVSAAVALLALQVQQTSAASLDYAPVTTSGTTDEICTGFPGYGAEVADKDCAITVEVDPTLPNITDISTVPVKYPELLANMTTTPSDDLLKKVGTVVLSPVTPTSEEAQDDYCTEAEKQGKPMLKEKSNCATGWDETEATRKLQVKRQLETSTNSDIAKLETYFGTKMEMTLKNLPTVGVFSPSPWAGPYWPTYEDSINVVWSAGQPSAAEKYAKAFNKDVTAFMDKVSKVNGIDSQSRRTKCTSDTDCSTLTDGSSCAIRAGKTSGYCIPSWFGICHAWAPAAILEAEPNCAVQQNGVTFQPMDLKALVSLVYDGARVSTVFTGARYNGATDSTDSYGRHSNNAYRDLNPAFFHVAAANLLGKLNASFVVDVTAGLEVWNQPVRGFKVNSQTSYTPEDAAKTFYGLQTYPWNAAAKSIMYVKARLSWIVETYTDGGLVSSGRINQYTTGQTYNYLLELDAAGKIIGGEWVYDSRDSHPDFLWLPKAKPDASVVTPVGLSYADVSMLLKKSVECTS